LKQHILFFLLISSSLFAQTGIGTTTPNASAKLDVYSTNKGFLPPRVTLTGVSDATTIASPAEGLLVYNLGSVGLQAGYYYWNGANWATIATATSAGNGVTATNMVNLYGEAYSTAIGKIAHANGYSFTVPVSGRFLFDFTSTGYANSADFTMTFKVRQGTTDIGTDAQISASNTVHVEYNGKVEVNLQAGTTYNVIVTSTGLRNSSDYDRVYYKQVAGNLPVTGQSVDYVNVQNTLTQTVVTGNNIKFNSVTAGNIPYDASTGNFTLMANKTYRLSGFITLDGGSTAGSELSSIWKNAAGTNLGAAALLFSANINSGAGGQGVADVIYTPTTNTTVALNAIWVSAGTVITRAGYTSATIEQIGSSAIINPWTLAGTSTYNTTGNVGIGTSSPDASSVLDISSSSKGLLPPRVALTSKSGTSSPVASPQTGLIVYNTASAGTGGDAVTPGYYYFNGTIWTRMDPEGWSTGVPITFGATTTAPTKGTISIDYVRYRNIGGKEYEVEYNFLQTTAGTMGTGDYLFSLPAGLQFDFTAPGQIANPTSTGYNAMKNRIASSQGDLIVSNFHSSSIVIPYDATRFRIMNNNWGNNTWVIHSPSNYAISDGTYGMKMTFKFKAL
jgi:hypothetical protein